MKAAGSVTVFTKVVWWAGEKKDGKGEGETREREDDGAYSQATRTTNITDKIDRLPSPVSASVFF